MFVLPNAYYDDHTALPTFTYSRLANNTQPAASPRNDITYGLTIRIGSSSSTYSELPKAALSTFFSTATTSSRNQRICRLNSFPYPATYQHNFSIQRIADFAERPYNFNFCQIRIQHKFEDPETYPTLKKRVCKTMDFT